MRHYIAMQARTTIKIFKLSIAFKMQPTTQLSFVKESKVAYMFLLSFLMRNYFVASYTENEKWHDNHGFSKRCGCRFFMIRISCTGCTYNTRFTDI